ncbi:MAG: DNA repair protein RecN [Oscillospiraceae bacterium]
MLSQLYIQNFAVIKELTVDFTDGFNVFTGETGAGKTMLINAISGVLGGRVSKDLVRTGEEKSTITAKFDNLSSKAVDKCSEMGYECDGELLVMREITAQGKSTCKINGRPTTLAILKEITSNLITIHGQQDGNIFADGENEAIFLDNYGEYVAELDEYKNIYSQFVDIKRKIKSINIDEAAKAQKIDILTYQINEINDANITVGESEQLIETRKKIRNSEKIKTSLVEAVEILNNADYSVIEQMENVFSCMQTLSQYIKDFEEVSQKCQEMVYDIQDIYETVRDNLDNFDDEFEDLNSIEDRIDLIHRLQRKYGSDENEILEFLDKAKKELQEINSVEENLDKYNRTLEKISIKLSQLANDITIKRQKCGMEFIEKVKKELTFLDMPSVDLIVDIKRIDYSENGQDEVTFLISTNPGEPPKPISKIASGGETSRIMLAIKNVMADKDDIQSLIFDEIDTGVSGTAAQKIGQKLSQVAQNHQVICITHLAQVASFGNSHFKISKKVLDNHTFTSVDELSIDDRIKELARIVVGDKITDISLKNAEEMLTDNCKRR